MNRHIPDGFFIKLTSEEESHLRDWAKQHFLPGRAPAEHWHPIIQDEWKKLQVSYSTAHEVRRAIVITNQGTVEGEDILETHCDSYEEYRSLPAVVEFHGKEYGKTGWSSDLGKACYKHPTPIAKAVRCE